MSVIFLPATLGPEMAAPILWAPGIFGSFCWKTPMPIKFLVLWGGGWRRGKCQFDFLCARGWDQPFCSLFGAGGKERILFQAACSQAHLETLDLSPPDFRTPTGPHLPREPGDLERCKRHTLPKGPSRTVFSTESDSVVFCYSVVNLLRIVIHNSIYIYMLTGA